MERYLFMKSLLDLLEKEEFPKRVFSVYLKGVALFTVFAGLAGFVIGWREVFRMQTSGIIGGTAFQILFAVAIYAGVHALLIGAERIKELREKPLFSSIGCEIIKAFANAYAGFATIMAIAGGVFIWFAGPGIRNANPLFRVLNHYYPFSGLQGDTFIQGLSFMIRGVAYTFLIFLGLYMVSELLSSVAKNSVRITGER